MTTSGIQTQSFSLAIASFSVTRVDLSRARTAAPAGDTSSTTLPTPVDRVELSPAAVAAPSVCQETTGTTTSSPATAESGAARRADALVGALDTDHDGSVTQEEFIEGGTALLRRAGARGHHRRVAEGDERDGSHVWRSRRFERRLEKLFDRVDVNQDGSVDKSELTAALEGVATRTTSTAPQTSASSMTAALSVTRITVVEVAIRQYAACADQHGVCSTVDSRHA